MSERDAFFRGIHVVLVECVKEVFVLSFGKVGPKWSLLFEHVGELKFLHQNCIRECHRSENSSLSLLLRHCST